jgi:dihydrofolate reductase
MTLHLQEFVKMKTQYYTASSLDGYIADEQHSLEWLFQFNVTPEDMGYADFIRDIGALAMGSSTYEWVRNHLRHSGEVWPYQQPAWIFTSRELPTIAGADLRFVRGDVRPVHVEMVQAAAGKNVWIVGGGELVGQFYDADLLDELIVQIAAVTLGRGAPILPRRIVTPPLRLQAVRSFGESFAELRYEVPKR